MSAGSPTPMTDSSTSPSALLDESPRPRRWWPLWLILGLLVVAGIGYAVWHSRSTQNTTPQAATTTSTATIKRTDLTETTSYDGVLTFADSRTISTKSAGTVTGLPAVGGTVKDGGALYSIDAQPTVLMYGSLPMYRTLQSGVSDGADVKQLETNLHALGYDPDGMTIDTVFDSSTTSAIEAWQKALGVTQNGIVTATQVQFLPGPIRVQAWSSSVGATVGTGSALYTASGTGRIATVSLAAADSTVAKVGEKVRVSLPSGQTVPGTVTDVSTQASSSSSSSGSGSGGGGGGAVNQQGSSSSVSSTKVAVTVAVDDPTTANLPDQTPVTVEFTSNSSKGVLAAPVTALVALAGGGYAVEVVDSGGATHLAAVTPGLYAVGGLVEVTGSGITEGTTVVIPSGS